MSVFLHVCGASKWESKGVLFGGKGGGGGGGI